MEVAPVALQTLQLWRLPPCNNVSPLQLHFPFFFFFRFLATCRLSAASVSGHRRPGGLFQLSCSILDDNEGANPSNLRTSIDETNILRPSSIGSSSPSKASRFLFSDCNPHPSTASVLLLRLASFGCTAADSLASTSELLQNPSDLDMAHLKWCYQSVALPTWQGFSPSSQPNTHSTCSPPVYYSRQKKKRCQSRQHGCIEVKLTKDRTASLSAGNFKVGFCLCLAPNPQRSTHRESTAPTVQGLVGSP